MSKKVKRKKDIEEMVNSFPISIVPKKKRGEYTNRQGEDQPNMDAILQGDQEPHDENHISNILRIDVRKIGMEDPLADFNAMVNNTEEDLVESAVKQLGDLSVELVSTSFGDAHSKKAIRYLQEMRRVAVRVNKNEICKGEDGLMDYLGR
jgi:hypothetical protein